LNGGIFLQISTNQVPAEISDYPEMMNQTKLKDGEQGGDGSSYKYMPFTELGDGGAYSYDIGKYQWKLGNKYLFLLAFNTKHEGESQKKIAIEIGKEVMKNFEAELNKLK
jgi:hypothetical protein